MKNFLRMKFAKLRFGQQALLSSLIMIVLSFTFLTFQSCKKDISVVPVSDITNSQEPEITEFVLEENNYESMVKTAAVGVFELAKNQTFRSKINDLIALQFDDDDNTLLKTVFQEVQNDNIDMISEFQNSINLWKQTVEKIDQIENTKYKNVVIYTDEDKINGVISGFNYHTKNKVYIQIYIPFIELVDLNSTPTIVLGMEDECNSDGYVILDDEISVINVDEEFARNNLVWVISVNETVDNEGKVPNPLYWENDSSQGPTGTVNPRISLDNAVNLSKIKITHKKECWLCGKAEVSIIVPAIIGIPNGFCDETKISQHIPIRKVSRKEIGDTIELKNTIIFPTSEFDVGNVEMTPLRWYEDMGWIYFEKDRRRKYERNEAIPPCAKEYTYTSKQTPYGIEGFFYLGPRDIWDWHEEGMFEYNGDINTPAGSGVYFKLKRVD